MYSLLSKVGLQMIKQKWKKNNQHNKMMKQNGRKAMKCEYAYHIEIAHSPRS